MLFSILLLALAIGLIRGGSIRNILSLRFRGPWLAFASILVEYVLLYCMRGGFIWSQLVVFCMVLLQYSLLLHFIWINNGIPFIRLIGLGILLNGIVILLNKGSMPLTTRVLEVAASSRSLEILLEGRYLTYHLVHPGTRFRFLGDVLYIPPPFQSFISIGDILLFMGVLLLIQHAIVKKSGSAA